MRSIHSTYSAYAIAALLLFIGCIRGADAETCDIPNAEARVLRAEQPETPPIARQQGIAGEVTVLVSLDEQSKIVGTRVFKTPSALLNNAALQAARASIYQTAVVNCYTVPTEYKFIIEFDSDAPQRPYYNPQPVATPYVAIETPAPIVVPATSKPTPKVKPTMDPLIAQIKREAAALQARIAYTDGHAWADLSADERHVAAQHGASPTHAYKGLPCRTERFDTATSHQETWWYGSDGSPCALRTAYHFVNGSLISVYHAP
jgi:hypothetical protein